VPKPGYRLTFHDEFDGDALDATLWSYGRTPRDAVTDDDLIKELYPCEIRDGIARLRVEKRRKAHELAQAKLASYSAKALKTYTAPGIATWGKFKQAYGWFEIRCKMPQAYGIWTAFWLLPDPLRWGVGAAEIDVVEMWTRRGNRINFAVHSQRKGGPDFGNSGIRVPGLADDFHVYALDWQPGSLTLYVDGVQAYTYTGKDVPSVATYMIVSGRTDGGQSDFVDESALPDDYEIDYVRVYQKE